MKSLLFIFIIFTTPLWAESLTTIEALKKTAEAGNLKAQLELANAYFNGYQITENQSKAIYWWQKADKQGSASAAYALGRSYFLGQGVKEDHLLAKKWYKKALKRGSKTALKSLQVIDKAYRPKRVLKKQIKNQRFSVKKLDNKKIKKLSPNLYIVQLLSVRDAEAALLLKKQYRLDDLYVIHYRVKGKNWYALLQGHYLSLAAAKKGVAAYPAKLSRLKPWIRPVSSLQKAIK